MQYLILFFIILYSNCSNNNHGGLNKSADKTYSNTINKQSFIDSPNNYIYQDIRHLENVLKLNNLETGFDSLQIRIWFPYFRNRLVAIMTKIQDKWAGMVYSFTYESDIVKNIDTIINVRSRNVTPTSGWIKFSKDLLHMGITTLPECESISGYEKPGTDGETYSIEIGTINGYRFYSYYNPLDNQNIREAQSFMQIINLIKTEFKIEQ